MHREQACLDLAQRRRAFPRALRTPGPLDLTPLVEYVVAHARSAQSEQAVLWSDVSEAGEPDEHPMKRQR